jgi:hypothetical protein
MSAKKVVKPKPPVKNDEEDGDDYPNKYQTIKGVEYLRPLHYAATPNDGMQWVPDVDNYPDGK